jgi:metallo-beta-lactamase class B
MSEVDTALTREMPERALMQLAPGKDDAICYPDQTIADGEVIKLGNTSIKCVLSPGHTPGTMSFFFDATDGERTLRVGYFGGIGFLTLYREYLQEYRLDPNMVEILGQTVEKLRAFEVDVVLGNHPYHNCTLEKRAYMLENEGSNPFINQATWGILLDALEARRKDFIALGY